MSFRQLDKIACKPSAPSRVRGYTLIELLVTCLIIGIMSVIAIPLVTTVMDSLQFKSAVTAATGAIRSARYQAIAQGYPMRVVFSQAASTYQLQQDATTSSFGVFDGVFTNVGTAEPISGSGTKPALGTDITLQFSPSGSVKAASGSTLTSCGATSQPCTMTLTYKGKTETIAVSAYGNIDVTP